MGTIAPAGIELSYMKTLSFITAVLLLLFGAVTSRAANLEKISAETGVPAATLQAERTSTGLGWASGQSFNDIVAMHQAGEGWGKIAHDNGLNLGRIVSDAHRSSQGTAHAQNLSTAHGKSTAVHGKSATTVHGKSATTVHGKSAMNIGRGHTSKMSSTRDVGRRSSFRSGFSRSYGMHSMGHMSGSHVMGSIGHGGK